MATDTTTKEEEIKKQLKLGEEHYYQNLRDGQLQLNRKK